MAAMMTRFVILFMCLMMITQYGVKAGTSFEIIKFAAIAIGDYDNKGQTDLNGTLIDRVQVRIEQAIAPALDPLAFILEHGINGQSARLFICVLSDNGDHFLVDIYTLKNANSSPSNYGEFQTSTLAVLNENDFQKHDNCQAKVYKRSETEYYAEFTDCTEFGKGENPKFRIIFGCLTVQYTTTTAREFNNNTDIKYILKRTKRGLLFLASSCGAK